jgi:hypothetical protein
LAKQPLKADLIKENAKLKAEIADLKKQVIAPTADPMTLKPKRQPGQIGDYQAVWVSFLMGMPTAKQPDFKLANGLIRFHFPTGRSLDVTGFAVETWNGSTKVTMPSNGKKWGNGYYSFVRAKKEDLDRLRSVFIRGYQSKKHLEFDPNKQNN